MPLVEIIDRNQQAPRYRYFIDTDAKPLGRGGMGVVYRGIQTDRYNGSKREVAIKAMHPGLPDDVIGRARNEASIRMVSPNLIEMIDFLECVFDSGNGPQVHYYVVSELLHGVSLLDLTGGRVTDGDGQVIPFAQTLYNQYTANRKSFVCFIAKNVLSGLFMLHTDGIIHRDIDPSNVMITSDNKVKLIDFGVAKRLTNEQNADGTRFGTFIGKAAYSAPELVSGDIPKHSAPSDLYSVGILMYALLLEDLPFKGNITQITSAVLSKPMPLKNIPDGKLRKIIGKATRKDIDKRYQSATAFITDIDNVLSGKDPNKDLYIIVGSVAVAVIVGLILGLLVI